MRVRRRIPGQRQSRRQSLKRTCLQSRKEALLKAPMLKSRARSFHNKKFPSRRNLCRLYPSLARSSCTRSTSIVRLCSPNRTQRQSWASSPTTQQLIFSILPCFRHPLWLYLSSERMSPWTSQHQSRARSSFTTWSRWLKGWPLRQTLRSIRSTEMLSQSFKTTNKPS